MSVTNSKVSFCKVNLVQEACAKCFAVHILKFEILQNTWKNKTKSIKMLDLLMKKWKLRIWCSLFHFFHVISKISNFTMWTAKHLAQVSCTELTLSDLDLLGFFISCKLVTTVGKFSLVFQLIFRLIQIYSSKNGSKYCFYHEQTLMASF